MSAGLQAALARAKTNQTRQRSAEASVSLQDEALQKNAPLQLPLWPEAVRAVPNGFLRSALFGAIGKGQRKYLEGELVAAVEGVEISVTGLRLDQGDLDVWQGVLHAVRRQDLGWQCRITSYALLKLAGKTDTGNNRAILKTRIERLRANTLTVTQDRYTYIGGLVTRAAKDSVTQEWVIELDEKMRFLFAADKFTQIDWAVRHALTGQPLAQWLHGFFSTHAKPFPLKVETLLALSGSENAEPRSSRQKLRKALDALKEAIQTSGDCFDYEIRGDLVHVEKQAKGAQRRHLARLGRKPRKPLG